MAEYAERDIVAQGEYYLKHIRAMTAEDLDSKSDIAAELAHRDIQIDYLKRQIDSGAEVNAFIQGALWWHYRLTRFTAFKSELDEIADEANRRFVS